MPEGDERDPQELYGGLSRNDFEEVMKALYEWAEAHPRRFEPIFFEMGRSYSPVEYVQAVAEGSDIGKTLLSYIAYQSRRTDTRPRTFVDRAILAERG
jgi:hypothetical protein